MFDRFTDRARKIMSLAHHESVRLAHGVLAPEHILFGIITENSGLAVNVLEELNVDLPRVLQSLALRMPPGTSTLSGSLPVTPAGKKTLEFAIAEARAMDHNYVGSEHLLLGLLRDSDSIAALVLFEFAVDLEKARKGVRDFLGEPAPGEQKDFNDQLAGLHRILELAGKEVMRSNSRLIEPEHLLAGLIISFDFENPWDIDFNAISRALEVHRPTQCNPEHYSIQRVSADSKEVMQLTLKNTIAMNASSAGPEHLLLGILEFGRGPAFDALTLHHVTLDAFRQKLRPSP